MAARKRASGYVREDERNTERITLRLDPETMSRLRSFAFEHGWSVAETVAEAFKALDRELFAEHEANILSDPTDPDYCDCDGFDGAPHIRSIAGCIHDHGPGSPNRLRAVPSPSEETNRGK